MDRLLRRSAPAGRLLSGFGVFCCGWLAMKAADWRGIVLWSLLAFACAAVGMAFTRIAGPRPR